MTVWYDTFRRTLSQVANYGMGGQYSTHLDPHGYYQNDSSVRAEAKIPYFEVRHADKTRTSFVVSYCTTLLRREQVGGDRFATFMVYLSDVSYGGDTVFPLAGLSASPKRGTGIFWLNLVRSGILS